MASTLNDLTTPCFVVDLERVKKNTERMILTCKGLGVQLRGHTKTHKTVEGAVLQTNGTKRCIAVSTLAEAEFYADNGFDDILFAYPVTEDKIKRCLDLLKRLNQFHIMVSGPDGLKCLENHIKDLPDGKAWSVFLEVDAGYGRTGFLWSGEEIVETARKLQSHSKITLEMLYVHCGNAYSVSTDSLREEVQSTNLDRLKEVQAKLSLHGINCLSGVGSTPTCSLPIKRNEELKEFHPGNYVFYDYEQYLINSCTESSIACRVMTRVIAHKPDKHMILVDCGFTALSHDGMQQRLPLDFCLIQGESNLRMIGMTQEIGKIIAKEGQLVCEKYPVGTVLFIYPFHSCATAVLHSVYHIHSGENVVAQWIPNRGW